MAIPTPSESPSRDPILLSINIEWLYILQGACLDYLLIPGNWEDWDEDLYYSINDLILRLMGDTPIFLTGFEAKSNTSQFPASNTQVTISFDLTVFDTGGWYNYLTGRYTPQQAGYYDIYASVLMLGNPTLCYMGVALNNSQIIAQAVGYSSCQLSASGPVFLNGTTDFVNVYGLNNAVSPEIYKSNGIGIFWAKWTGN